MGKNKKKKSFTNPKDLDGSIVGPGGPHDRAGVIVDASNAVIVEACALARVDEASENSKSEVIAMLLSGRVLQRNEQADVLFLLDMDGLATVLTEIYGLIGRMGNDALALKADIEQRMEAMLKAGHLSSEENQ